MGASQKEPILNCLKDVQELYRTRPVVTPEMLPELERDAMGEYIKCRKQVSHDATQSEIISTSGD